MIEEMQIRVLIAWEMVLSRWSKRFRCLQVCGQSLECSTCWSSSSKFAEQLSYVLKLNWQLMDVDRVSESLYLSCFKVVVMSHEEELVTPETPLDQNSPGYGTVTLISL